MNREAIYTYINKQYKPYRRDINISEIENTELPCFEEQKTNNFVYGHVYPKSDFGIYLKELLFEKGIHYNKLPEVYHMCKISKQTFFNIWNALTMPSKKTAYLICLGLKLNFGDSQKLLEAAGFAFTPYDRESLFIEYCITHNIYDLNDINETYYDTFGDVLYNRIYNTRKDLFK